MAKEKQTLLPHEWDMILEVKENKIIQTVANNNELQSLVKLIVHQIIKDVGKKTKNTSVFKKNNHAHICLLIDDLVYIFSALKFREIKHYLLNYFEIVVDERTLKEYIYSLSKLNIIMEKHAGAKYFLPTDKNSGFIKYKFNEGHSKDVFSSSNEVKASMLDFYTHDDLERCHVLGIEDDYEASN